MAVVRRHRLALLLAALVLACFAVYAVPAGRGELVVGTAPLAVAGEAAPGHRVALRLPDAFAPVPDRPGVWQAAQPEGLARCRTVLSVLAEASNRGVRYEAQARRLSYRFGGRRLELPVQQADRLGVRLAFRSDVTRAGVSGRPVIGVVRFPTPPRAPFAAQAPATLVRAEVLTFAETTSAVQRTPQLLARCRRHTLATAPAALDAVAATAEVVAAPTSARRGAP